MDLTAEEQLYALYYNSKRLLTKLLEHTNDSIEHKGLN